MSKRTHNVQTPGDAEPAVEATTTTEAAAVEAQAAVAEALAPQEAPPVVMQPQQPLTGDALKQAQLDQQVRDTKDLVGSSAALDWGHLTQQKILGAKVNPKLDDGLPYDYEINPATIPYGRSVLTKQGWVTSTASATKG
jgi:hypothetical protein